MHANVRCVSDLSLSLGPVVAWRCDAIVLIRRVPVLRARPDWRCDSVMHQPIVLDAHLLEGSSWLYSTDGVEYEWLQGKSWMSRGCRSAPAQMHITKSTQARADWLVDPGVQSGRAPRNP